MSSKMKKELKKNGFFLLRNVLERKKINILKKQMIQVFKQFVKIKEDLPLDDQLDLGFKKSCKIGTKLRSNIYKALSNLQELYILSADKKITNLISKLNFKSPRNQGTSLFAVEPNVDQFLTEIHQDIRNNFCSLKSINLWMPLNSAKTNSGGLGIYAGSHKLGPCKHIISKKSGFITIKDNKKLKKFKLVKINNFNAGDVLFFSPFCWHFSIKNYSNKIRWTAAICFDDAAKTAHFRKSFNPYNRSSFVTLKSNEVLFKEKNKNVSKYSQ